MVVPQGNSAAIGKTDSGIFQSLQHHKRRTARFRFATRPSRILSTVIQGLKELIKAGERTNEQTQAVRRNIVPNQPTFAQPFAARPEADSKVIGTTTESQSISPARLTL